MYIDAQFPFLHTQARLEPQPVPVNATPAQKQQAKEAIKAFNLATTANIDALLRIPSIYRAIQIRAYACSQFGYEAVDTSGDVITDSQHPANLFINESDLQDIMGRAQRDIASYGPGYARITSSVDTDTISLAGDDVRLVFVPWNRITKNVSNNKLSYTVQGVNDNVPAEKMIELPYQTEEPHMSLVSMVARSGRLYRHVLDWNNLEFDKASKDVPVIEITEDKRQLPTPEEQQKELELINLGLQYARDNSSAAIIRNGKMNRPLRESDAMPFKDILNWVSQDSGTAIGVDSKLLGDPTASKYSNYDTALLALYELTCIPEVIAFVNQINRKVKFADGATIAYNADAVAELQSRIAGNGTNVTISENDSEQ